MAKSLKINDKVTVISGDHKGETAKIVGIDRGNGKAMLEGITGLAAALPQHTVVPYPNLPKSRYPLNTDCVPAGEQTKS